MKYCTHCGRELLDDAVVCMGCGCSVQAKNGFALDNNFNLSRQENSTLLKTLSQRLNINGVIWLVIGVLQIILGIFVNRVLFVVGFLNIVSGCMNMSYSKTVLTDQSEIIKKIEPLAGPIITLIYNVIFGGIIGVVGSIYYLTAIRGYVMENRNCFENMAIKLN